ncbi:peptidoglycan-binding protein [Pedobacter sp. MR2016-24]|uniref:peptidoglycan-binding protein n=1 Tax=Pedobacter sp. MR2016-24 TaxID=2994466 RepID=UPI00224656C4|nr:peptidoglycan-binding protein [Pedobacter sp. MR2016-24]MCX2483748.1 peptidoglycan-binding protein [Pedobacter sp. MR2016-24]
MATIKFFLGVACFTAGSGSLQSERDFITRREGVVKRATNEIGVREATGRNDGKRVIQFLAAVNLKSPEPWCAAFVSWVFLHEGFPEPKSGWSPDLFPKSRLARSALPGNVLGIYFADKKRIAHVGLITEVNGSWITSVEGNTNVSGSREGDGVYRKLRHIRTIYRMSDWIRPKTTLP